MDLPRDLKAGPRAPALRCSRLCSCDLYNKWPRRAAPASPRRIHSRIKFSVPWNILKPMHILYIYAYIIDIYIHAHKYIYIYDSVVLYFNTLVSAKLYILSYTLQSMTLNKGARRSIVCILKPNMLQQLWQCAQFKQCIQAMELNCEIFTYTSFSCLCVCICTACQSNC